VKKLPESPKELISFMVNEPVAYGVDVTITEPDIIKSGLAVLLPLNIN
jgi:hypothetical protein